MSSDTTSAVNFISTPAQTKTFPTATGVEREQKLNPSYQDKESKQQQQVGFII
jgi:hypothetical protein